jgi:hypothetical protein
MDGERGMDVEWDEWRERDGWRERGGMERERDG